MKRQPHQMVKHTQTIRRQQHFVGLVLKELTLKLFGMNNLKRLSKQSEPSLTLPVLCISQNCIEIKTNLNFIKPFEAPQRSVKIKI